jgi:putative holliday junction resolvase
VGRILAFDFGKKRVGIAVTDPLQIIANSLDTVPTKEVYEFLKIYCSKQDVEAFVVGYPFAHGHRENEVVADIEAFIAALSKLYPDKKVHKVDESFTSKMASQTLLMSGVNRKVRRNKSNVDAISANIILQSFLEMKSKK